jgi:hypothetical protein
MHESEQFHNPSQLQRKLNCRRHGERGEQSPRFHKVRLRNYERILDDAGAMFEAGRASTCQALVQIEEQTDG